MVGYEHEPGLNKAGLDEFLVRVKDRLVPDMGIKIYVDVQDAGNVPRGQSIVPAKRMTAYIILSSVVGSDRLEYQEMVDQEIIATQEEYEEFQEKISKRESEIIQKIQAASGKTRLFSGRVVP